MSGLTYKKSGVDISEGDRFVSLISPMVKKTFRKEVMTEIGAFSALFKLDLKKYKEPVLVSGTDGVGTKLKIAFMTGRHDTVGIDLVAMCVNDIITCGAEPLFFLDYFATGKLRAEDASRVVEGIVKGCKDAGCSLIGGETAEMPDFYKKNEYDLSGFAVGVVEKGKIVDGSGIKDGDVLIGVRSNGLHSNGYSLVRKLFFEIGKMGVSDKVPGLGATLGKELLKPTRIYAKAVKSLKNKVLIKGMAHVTGGGIPGNLTRILPEGIRAVVREGSWEIHPIFKVIQARGKVPEDEMRRTFNMGIGYIFVVGKKNVKKSLEILKQKGYDSYVVGGLEKGKRELIYVKD
jgi:phosphoribosylformylglycinamidine cyclo-ligase